MRVFMTVTLPMLGPAVMAGAIAAFLISFDDVPVALFIGGGEVTTLPVRILNSIQFELSPVLLALSTVVAGAILSFSSYFVERCSASIKCSVTVKS